MSNVAPNKPCKNHPWRKAPSSEVVSWASQESYVRNVTNLSVARNSTLKRKMPPAIPSR